MIKKESVAKKTIWYNSIANLKQT